MTTKLLSLLAAALLAAPLVGFAHWNSSADVEADSEVEANWEKLPPGIQHAPGIQKRIDNGKGLPPGLKKLLDRRAPDTTVPMISGAHVTAVTSTSADVKWSTDELTTGEVRYAVGTTVSADSPKVESGRLVFNHSAHLSGLAPDTQYAAMIMAKDASGNVKESGVLLFRTQASPPADTTAPSVFFVTVSNVTETSARVSWLTSELASGKLWLSTSSSVDTSISPTYSSTGLTFFHSFVATGLNADTRYYYTIGGADAAANVVLVTGNSFETND